MPYFNKNERNDRKSIDEREKRTSTEHEMLKSFANFPTGMGRVNTNLGGQIFLFKKK